MFCVNICENTIGLSELNECLWNRYSWRVYTQKRIEVIRFYWIEQWIDEWNSCIYWKCVNRTIMSWIYQQNLWHFRSMYRDVYFVVNVRFCWTKVWTWTHKEWIIELLTEVRNKLRFRVNCKKIMKNWIHEAWPLLSLHTHAIACEILLLNMIISCIYQLLIASENSSMIK